MSLKRGDHVCALYSTPEELARTVAEFLAEGLRRNQQCWYVGVGPEIESVREALRALGVDVDANIAQGALKILFGTDAYVVQGAFNPEVTLRVFNDAIEKALRGGFTGFRAAAEMSWALQCDDGTQQLIIYEALLRPLFANRDAIGLCLYDRNHTPLNVINGALATHPIVGIPAAFAPNQFYDVNVQRMPLTTDGEVLAKIGQLAASAPRSET